MAVAADIKFECAVAELVLLTHTLGEDYNLVMNVPSGGSFTLEASSATPATKAWGITALLSGGVATIDLTALTRGGELSNVDFSGLKLQLVYFKATAANTDKITIVTGAVNGYDIWGAALGSVTLDPGAQIMHSVEDDLQDVAGGDLAIDLASPDANAEYTAILVAG